MVELIKRVTARGKPYNYFWPTAEMMAEGARPVPIPLDPDLARAEVSRLVSIIGSKDRPDFHKYIIQMLKNARARCAKSGVGFDLVQADVVRMMDRQGYRCAVSGIAFDLETTGPNRKVWRRPFRPSIDRIWSRGPYSKANVRLVCVAVNVALNEWGDEILSRIARGIVGLETLREQRLEIGLAIATRQDDARDA